MTSKLLYLLDSYEVSFSYIAAKPFSALFVWCTKKKIPQCWIRNFCFFQQRKQEKLCIYSFNFIKKVKFMHEEVQTVLRMKPQAQ